MVGAGIFRDSFRIFADRTKLINAEVCCRTKYNNVGYNDLNYKEEVARKKHFEKVAMLFNFNLPILCAGTKSFKKMCYQFLP